MSDQAIEAAAQPTLQPLDSSVPADSKKEAYKQGQEQEQLDKEPNGFVKVMRKIYRPVGFSKGYNFPLFIIFAGAMMGFVLARFEYLNYGGIYKNGALPGEWYWFSSGFYRIALLMHLATVLPAGFLAVFQFVPVIRHKIILFHRLNGYVIILLFLVSNAAALMMARRAAGGEIATQAYIGTLAILTTCGLFLALWNIKCKQIDQHRAWMLRTWFWAGTIITLRIIMFISVHIVSLINDYYSVTSCAEIKSLIGASGAKALYPMCFLDNGTTQGYVAVKGDFSSSDPNQIAATFHMTFGTAGWLALLLHWVGVEIYLKLTPRESERLRQVSYERQVEAGFKNPGSAGLVIERFGDADPWVPPAQRKA